ncbi:MAG: DUF3108 domain-containing protein [Alphaproteobacteria bacterium]|nr:DUF3108 domain-containing protein [Alphaproteobacteria bacterium]
MRVAATAAAILCAMATTATPAHADRVLLTFDGSAYGFIPLGHATMDISLGDDSYRAAAQIKSGGLSALFDRTDLRGVATGAVAGPAVSWRTYDLDHAYARKRRVVALRATPDGPPQAQITPAFRPSVNPVSLEEKRVARDPISSIVAMSVAVARTGTCAGAYPTFDGRFRYDLVLRVEGRDRHAGGGYSGPVLKCRMRYVPVSGYDTPDNMRKRIPEGEIWFALDGTESFAPPVRVTAPLPLGHAAIRLASYKRAQVDVASETVTPTP